MAIVRCPIHDIPYNDANPRGCPACAADKEGRKTDADVMKQLARVSMGLPAVEELPPPPPAPGLPTERPVDWEGPWPPPVTRPPRLPVPEPTILQKVLRLARTHLSTALAITGLAIALPLLWIITRPDFIPDLNPPIALGDGRPAAITPNVPVLSAFAATGVIPPFVNPDSPTLTRYPVDAGLTVDALNRVVYAVTVLDGSRTWRGLRVGTDEQATRGAMALLGAVNDTVLSMRGPIVLNGFQVVTELTQRPRRRVIAQVRPPNGCHDVQVDLAPRAIGRLRQQDDDLWALARIGAALEWVNVRIRVVSRALPGPYAGAPVCPLPE